MKKHDQQARYLGDRLAHDAPQFESMKMKFKQKNENQFGNLQETMQHLNNTLIGVPYTCFNEPNRRRASRFCRSDHLTRSRSSLATSTPKNFAISRFTYYMEVLEK